MPTVSLPVGDERRAGRARRRRRSAVVGGGRRRGRRRASPRRRRSRRRRRRARAGRRRAAGGGGARECPFRARELVPMLLRPRFASRAARPAGPARPAGSSVSPVCTGEHWMIVLDGATSQWKRSDAGSAAIGPASASPAAIRAERVEVAADRVDVGVRRERARAGPVERDARGEEAPRAAEQDDAGVDALAALDARDHAHDRVLERARRHGAPPRPRRRTRAGPRAGASR